MIANSKLHKRNCVAAYNGIVRKTKWRTLPSIAVGCHG